MCSNYRPVTSMDRMLTFFGVEREKDEIPRDVFPLGLAPFIRLSTEGQEGGKPALVAEDGEFGLTPGSWAKLEYGRKSYNARAETVHEKISYKNAWGTDDVRVGGTISRTRGAAGWRSINPRPQSP